MKKFRHSIRFRMPWTNKVKIFINQSEERLTEKTRESKLNRILPNPPRSPSPTQTILSVKKLTPTKKDVLEAKNERSRGLVSPTGIPQKSKRKRDSIERLCRNDKTLKEGWPGS